MPEETGQGLLLRAKIEGVEYEIDLANLTIAEEIETEEYFNMPFPAINAAGWVVSTKGLIFFAYLARKRKDPTYTLAQAIALSAEDFDVTELGANADDDQADTEGAVEPKRPTEGRKTSGRRRSQS